MKPPAGPRAVRHGRRGAALLLSLLVLIVILAIVYQITRATGMDQIVARKDLVMTQMDHAIESALLQIAGQLKEDAEAAAAADEGGGMGDPGGGDPAAGDPVGSGDPGAAGEGNPDGADSKMDEWATPVATSINEIDLRILIQDEDSKYNVLNMLAEDEELAQDAYDRVVRVLDNCREGTDADIDSAEADELARVMREHMLERTNSFLPRARLLTDDEENDRLGMPLSLREFVVLDPFREHHFRDFFDKDGERVHSIGSFLTVWTSPGVGDEAEPTAGFGVNINTAPLAVLNALTDDRDVPSRFWDDVLEYRNEEEEPEPGEDPPEPILDEFGEEILPLKIFDSLDELEEVYEFGTMEPEVKAKVESLLAVQSHVFSVFVTARVATSDETGRVFDFRSRREREMYERSGTHLVRTVRAVLWRQSDGEEVTITPLLRWEVLDYAPLEVLDYREDF